MTKRKPTSKKNKAKLFKMGSAKTEDKIHVDPTMNEHRIALTVMSVSAGRTWVNKVMGVEVGRAWWA